MAAHLAAPGSTITLDNQAVVDHGPMEPHREASDMDLRSRVSPTLGEKNIRVRWIPGHRKTSSARDAQELDDIITTKWTFSPNWQRPLLYLSTIPQIRPAYP